MNTPREVVTLFFQRVRSGRAPDEAEVYFAPSVAAHQVVSGAESRTFLRTPEDYAAHVREMIAQYGPFELEIEEMLAEGGKVFVRWRQSGIHVGSVFGEAPTGSPLIQRGSAVYRVEGGRIVEYWIQVESKGIADQIEAAAGVVEDAGRRPAPRESVGGGRRDPGTRVACTTGQ